MSISEQFSSDAKQDQQRNGDGQVHPRPRVDRGDLGVGEAQHPFAIAEALLAANPATIFSARRLGKKSAVRDQESDVRLPIAISRPSVRQGDASWVVLIEVEPSERAAPMVGPKPQRVELSPPPVTLDLNGALCPNDVANSKFFKQIDRRHVAEPSIGRQPSLSPIDRLEHVANDPRWRLVERSPPRAVGWAEIDIRPIDVVCTLPEKELVPYLARLGPVGRALQEADDQTRARVIKAARAAFDPYVHGAEVHFTAACWTIGARASRSQPVEARIATEAVRDTERA